MTLSRLATSALYERYTPAGIAGYGGWASVTAATGTYTTGTYNDGTVDWVYYQWTGSGSVTTTAGVVDVLVVSGGGGSSSTLKGNGGRIATGLHQFSATTHTIQVGLGGVTSGTGVGQESYIGPILAATSGIAYNNDHATGAGGTGVTAGDTAKRAGYTSAITGTSVTYARGMVASPVANTGDGGDSVAGANGVVIIRVPVNPELWGAPPAQGVLPNLGVGWASVTAATGTFTKSSYTDADGQWTYWKWTGSGSVTVTTGLVDTLLVGGGGYYGTGADATNGYWGNGGQVVSGLHTIPDGANTISVGTTGTESKIGSLYAARGSSNYGSSTTGAGGTAASRNLGFTSSITGSSYSYGVGSSPSTIGGGASYPSQGASGVVIIRVPTAFDLT